MSWHWAHFSDRWHRHSEAPAGDSSDRPFDLYLVDARACYAPVPVFEIPR